MFFPFSSFTAERRQDAIHSTSSPRLAHYAFEQSLHFLQKRPCWIGYLTHVIFPYVDSLRAANHLDDNLPALVISDNFKGQVTAEVKQLLEEHNVHAVKLRPNCTDRVQPKDISVNKAAKDFFRQKLNTWYAEQVAQQLDDGEDLQPINLRGAAMKSIEAKLII